MKKTLLTLASYLILSNTSFLAAQTLPDEPSLSFSFPDLIDADYGDVDVNRRDTTTLRIKMNPNVAGTSKNFYFDFNNQTVFPGSDVEFCEVTQYFDVFPRHLRSWAHPPHDGHSFPAQM